MTNLERARAFFKGDTFSTELMGIEIDAVEKGFSKCHLNLTECHLNAEGHIMGGVMFTLADFAFAVAANLDQPMTVSLSCQVTFLSPPRGRTLYAEAICVRQGHSTCYYDVRVTDEEGTIVTVVGISGFIKRPHADGTAPLAGGR